MSVRFAFIIPVYNRPKELGELLDSLTRQDNKQFEVVVVEDGSTLMSDTVVQHYKNRLNVRYFFKENSGPGLSRNFGFAQITCPYGVFLDSDCILPPEYADVVIDMLDHSYIDAFGGPDAAGADFSPLQKAISYAMTSFLTTGGIRGGGERLDKFYPRSFNMGYSREVFEATGGFSAMRFGEDIDMSLRIVAAGFGTRLLKSAFVYHKRRTRFTAFFKQVFNSGVARINLYKRHPKSLKLVHFAPSCFVLGCLALVAGAIWLSPLVLWLLALYAALIFIDATYKNLSLSVGLLAVPAAFIQLWGYGCGFLTACFRRLLLGQGEFACFVKKYK